MSNLASGKFAKKIAASFKRVSKFPIETIVMVSSVPGIDFSDNWSFWEEGYPAVMITDTAFYRNPNYHSSTDTYEKLDYASMAEVINGLTGALLDLAKN